MKKLYIVLFLFCYWACSPEQPPVPPPTSTSLSSKTKQNIAKKITQAPKEDSVVVVPKDKDAVTVVIVPSSNGYEYVTYGKDINDFLEKQLDKFPSVKILDFPYGKMGGSGYFGVFRAKDATKILKNVSADFLIMTYNTGILRPQNGEHPDWGYKVRLLNTKSLRQTNAVSQSGKRTYEELDSFMAKDAAVLVDLLHNKDIAW